MDKVFNRRFEPAANWFNKRDWKPFEFQIKTWENYLQGKSGLLNAPTGSGKTYALWLACLLESINEKRQSNPTLGLQVVWITPLRALAKDIHKAMEVACNEMGVQWNIGLRTGDSSISVRKNQKEKPPQALVITPESLHVLLSQSDYPNYFSDLKCLIVDEWHELLGTKRGVATELAISRLKSISGHRLRIWGISATIGNLQQAQRVLLGEDRYKEGVIVKSDIEKKVLIESILPEKIEKFPWSGHLGIHLLDKIIPLVDNSRSTLLFTNTRSQAEIWYQAIIKKAPHLSGVIGMHHGSLGHDIRTWVEEAISDGKLKLVVCTSSLDLGVDFHPVDTVIQIGGPKGISRFFQRAGRSGHNPGKESIIYFVPTHSLELVEGAALRRAIENGRFESRKPLEKCMDVLIQYLVTLAVGGGFVPKDTLKEIIRTFSFRFLNSDEWNWCLNFITKGGETLGQYDEFLKVYDEDGVYKIINNKAAIRHKLSIGTIVADSLLTVKWLTGGTIGNIEESFVARLKPGDRFWFSGKNLEFVKLKDLTVLVKLSKRKSGITPIWGGGRLPLSSMLAKEIKQLFNEALLGKYPYPEMKAIKPILDLQFRLSALPANDKLLIEYTNSKFGYHVFFYPFEGLFVHEILSSIIALRICRILPISFSISMNDYGFELLSDQEIPIEEALSLDLFSEEHLIEDMYESINMTEIAERKFRDIATIAGLVFSGYPGKNLKSRHLQASSGILFKVFKDYDPENLLLKQSMNEVLTMQLEQARLFEAIRNINNAEIIFKRVDKITPFAFPIFVNNMRRQNMTTEQLHHRILKMQAHLEGTSLED